MNTEQEASLKKANLRLAIILAVVAAIFSLWPLYYLNGGIGL